MINLSVLGSAAKTLGQCELIQSQRIALISNFNCIFSFYNLQF